MALAREGYDIAGNATGFDPEDLTRGLAETGVRCQEAGATFLPLPADVADLASHEGLVTACKERFGGIDLLVSNAGVAPLQRLDFLETTPESYDRVMGVNLRGAFFLAQRVARHMVEAEGDRGPTSPTLVFITSTSADTSSTNRVEYCVSKAGLSMLAQGCAHRLAPHGVNVYEVRPGIIRTDMTVGVKEKYDALMAQGLVPQTRWGEPEDVGRAVAALARGDFAYSTGGVFEVSGGMSIKRL
jgi:NAD(P)-dependent dehydrogenase (short-subunit alcohol dehydrogenase family)